MPPRPRRTPSTSSQNEVARHVVRMRHRAGLIVAALLLGLGLLLRVASSDPVAMWHEPTADIAVPRNDARRTIRRRRRHPRKNKSGPMNKCRPGSTTSSRSLLLVVVAALVTAAALSIWRRGVLRRRLTPRVPPPVPHAPRVPSELTEVADQMLEALHEGTPRNAIVACWVRLEGAVAGDRYASQPRRHSDRARRAGSRRPPRRPPRTGDAGRSLIARPDSRPTSSVSRTASRRSPRCRGSANSFGGRGRPSSPFPAWVGHDACVRSPAGRSGHRPRRGPGVRHRRRDGTQSPALGRRDRDAHRALLVRERLRSGGGSRQLAGRRTRIDVVARRGQPGRPSPASTRRAVPTLVGCGVARSRRGDRRTRALASRDRPPDRPRRVPSCRRRRARRVRRRDRSGFAGCGAIAVRHHREIEQL